MASGFLLRRASHYLFFSGLHHTGGGRHGNAVLHDKMGSHVGPRCSIIFFFFFALRFKAALQQSSIVLSSQVKGTGLKAEGEAAKMSRYPDFYSQGSISKKAGY